MPAFLEKMFLGNSVLQWLIALGAAVVAFLVLELLKGVGVRRIRRMAEKTDTDWDDLAVDLLARTKLFVIVVVSLWVGAYFLKTPPAGPSPEKILKALRTLVWVALALQLAFWGNGFIAYMIRRAASRREADKESLGKAAFGTVEFLAKFVLWSLLLIIALDNLGVDVSSLLTGLGVGGIAVALAVQNILGDVLCSVSILLDKPFEVGDFIVVGEKMGTVERIGVKTTRLRSLQGEQIVFPNAALVGSQIQNFKRMNERRVVLSFGVLYETPAEKVEAIPGMVREILEKIPDTRIDRAHFNSFGDSSLDFEVVYYVLSADYNLFMDRRQAINLALLRRFEKEGIGFAYPTRTLYVQQAGGAS